MCTEHLKNASRFSCVEETQRFGEKRKAFLTGNDGRHGPESRVIQIGAAGASFSTGRPCPAQQGNLLPDATRGVPSVPGRLSCVPGIRQGGGLSPVTPDGPTRSVLWGARCRVSPAPPRQREQCPYTGGGSDSATEWWKQSTEPRGPRVATAPGFLGSWYQQAQFLGSRHNDRQLKDFLFCESSRVTGSCREIRIPFSPCP